MLCLADTLSDMKMAKRKVIDAGRKNILVYMGQRTDV
jgi:hypothetical protein